MESRRGPRMVIDPKVRQVGFVTPGFETGSAASGAVVAGDVIPGANSPSPVMIPLARLLDPSPPKAVPVPIPVPVPSPPLPGRKVEDDNEMPLGNYNPSDLVLGGSPTSSMSRPSNGGGDRMDDGFQAYGELSPSVVAKLNSSLMEMSLQNANAAVALSGAGTDVVQETAVTVSSNETKKLKDKTSRAERRALQEAQRAAKAAAKSSAVPKAGSEKEGMSKAQKKETSAEKKPVPGDKKLSDKGEKEKRKETPAIEKDKRKDVPAPRMQFDDEQRVAKAKRRSIVEQTETKHRVELFRHLPQFLHAAQLPSLEVKFFQDDVMHIHRAVYQVGLKYLTWDIVGGNARSVAMLMAFREMIRDYSTPPEKTITRDLTAKINSQVSFLITCRPLSISMGNAIRFLKLRIVKLPVTLTESEAKASLISQIDTFIQEKIVLADNEIVKHAVTKIRDGDVLLTHGSSCIVEMILSHAHKIGRKFRVVVVDSRPRLEGRTLLRKLVAQGIQCTYTHINAVSYIMQEVTRVFLGAASVLSNGTVYSRVGTAGVAMVAHAFRVPVLICCETYKFHERVQLDSICSNELGDPDALVKVPGRKEFDELVAWAKNEHLQLLNLLYDATPADYVSMVITELGMVPPTSVPVILREYRKEPTL